VFSDAVAVEVSPIKRCSWTDH